MSDTIKFYGKKYYKKYKSNSFNPDKTDVFHSYLFKNLFNLYVPNEDDKILDVGSGWGNVAFKFASLGHHATSIDFSSESINICKRKAKELGIKEHLFQLEDATNTSFDEGSFDVVYAADFVEHIYPKETELFIKEMYRVLKKNGKIVIYTPTNTHWLHYIREYTPFLSSQKEHVDYKTILSLSEQLKRVGFRIIKKKYFTSHLPFFSYIELLLLKIPLFQRRFGLVAEKK